jgi:hypothetical protein
MASLYDYGVPNAVNSMVNLLDVVSQDKARKEQANHNRILQQKAMFEMDRLIKEEKKQSQKINMSGLLLAQGAHPEDAKVIENIWEKSGLGQRGPLGEMIIERRNIAEAMKTVQDDPKNRLALAQTSFQRLQTQHNQLEEEQQKIIERNSTDYQNDKKYQDNLKKIQFIKQQAGLRYKQIEEAQMALDPKLRETMEEKALARKDKAEQAELNRQSREDIAAQNRDLRKDLADQSNALRKELKSMNQGRETPQYAGAKAAAAIEAKIKSAEKVLGRPLSDQEKRQMYLNDPYGIIPSGQAPQAPTSKPLDKETAKAILKEAKGNKDKARELAKSRGYTF